jgi:hypothetical protein
MSRIEREFGVELGQDTTGPKGTKAAEYEQFEATLRLEAANFRILRGLLLPRKLYGNLLQTL